MASFTSDAGKVKMPFLELVKSWEVQIRDELRNK